MHVVYGRQAASNPSLFAGHAWMDAAEAWAADEAAGPVAGWLINQRFKCGQQWYGIDWADAADWTQLGGWVVWPIDTVGGVAPRFGQ